MIVRDYLFDIAKIVEGAAKGDYSKVIAYSEALASRLDSAGESAAAKRMRQIIGKSPAASLALSRKAEHSPLPVDSESRIPVADEERPERGDVPVFLNGSTRDVIDQFIRYFRAADRLIAHGVGISPSLLIYGPPGVGKTQLARHIASELGFPLITARSDSLISSYLGSTAKNLRLLFEHASSRPCVLFLDEFDALAKMRDDERELGELKRVVISLMQNIDAMGRDHVLLAATNHQHLLDPAIWRRFAYKVEMQLPEMDARTAMLRHFMGKFADEQTIELAAILGNGLTGAQLKDIVDDAIREAILSGQDMISPVELTQRFIQAPSLAELLWKLRDIDGKRFTQKKLAEMFGISQPYVSQILKQRVING